MIPSNKLFCKCSDSRDEKLKSSSGIEPEKLLYERSNELMVEREVVELNPTVPERDEFERLMVVIDPVVALQTIPFHVQQSVDCPDQLDKAPVGSVTTPDLNARSANVWSLEHSAFTEDTIMAMDNKDATMLHILGVVVIDKFSILIKISLSRYGRVCNWFI